MLVLAHKFDSDSMYGESPTDAQLVSLLNWGIQYTARFIRLYDPAVVLTLTADTAQYDLRSLSIVSKKVVRPYGVIINGNRLVNKKGDGYGVWTLGEFEREHPAWMGEAASTPVKAAFYGKTLIVHQKPTQAIVDGGSNYISGTVLPIAKTNDSNGSTGKGTSPDLPDELHEATVWITANKNALANASEAEGWKRLGAYRADWFEIANEVRIENENQMLDWGTEQAYGTSDWMDA